VISANVKLALRCRSILSENTRVLRARSGSPEKKSVSALWSYVSIVSKLQSHDQAPGMATDIFEVLEEVGDSLSFAIGEDVLVQAVAGPRYAWHKTS
jgi:hypothetical protein